MPLTAPWNSKSPDGIRWRYFVQNIVHRSKKKCKVRGGNSFTSLRKVWPQLTNFHQTRARCTHFYKEFRYQISWKSDKRVTCWYQVRETRTYERLGGRLDGRGRQGRLYSTLRKERLKTAERPWRTNIITTLDCVAAYRTSIETYCTGQRPRESQAR